MEKLKEIIRKANSLGIPLPLLRDPKSGKSSVSLTMMVLSFNTALFGQLGKFTKILGDVDMSSAMGLFVATSALYFGRKFQKNGDLTTVEAPQKENE